MLSVTTIPRFRYAAGALLSSLIVAGCTYPHESIPSGMYVSRSTDERIIATESQLTLELRVFDENGTHHQVRKVCSYNVHPDSEIWTWGYTSGEYAEIYGRFKWRWDGTKIIREWVPYKYNHRIRGPTETTEFVRER